MPSRHVAVSLLFTAAAACGSTHDPVDQPDADTTPSADADPTGDASGPGPDGIAPSVAMVTPPDGAAGVRADAEIVIVFSEPMAPGSVEAAWTSVGLPADAVGFAWNAARDTLTVTPHAQLVLATGTGEDPSTVVARSYMFEIGVGATDASGMALAAPLTSSFTTAKRMTVELAQLDTLCRTVREDGLVLGDGPTRAIGDTSANLQYKTFASFALPSLPAGIQIERAELAGAQNGVTGVPYVFGDVVAQHVNAASIGPAFDAPPLATIGAFSTNAAQGTRVIDVTAAFGDDLAQHVARGERTQYRLEFPTATDGDAATDTANFSALGFELTVLYLAD